MQPSSPQRFSASKKQRLRKQAQRRKLLVFFILGILIVAFLLVLFFRPIKQTTKIPEELTPPYIIALDAGHGGEDVGAIGLVQEYVLTESTIQNLQYFLENDENFTPVLCRPLTGGASVNQRSKAALKANAALLISVHGNSDTSPDTTGFECYPTPPGREYHELSLRFASLISAEMGSAGAKQRGINGIRYAYYENDSSSKFFCESNDTSIYEQKSFGIVENSGCPSVLVEQCFITSPADMAFWGNEEGCYRAALCYYHAICSYFGTSPVF